MVHGFAPTVFYLLRDWGLRAEGREGAGDEVGGPAGFARLPVRAGPARTCLRRQCERQAQTGGAGMECHSPFQGMLLFQGKAADVSIAEFG